MKKMNSNNVFFALLAFMSVSSVGVSAQSDFVPLISGQYVPQQLVLNDMLTRNGLSKKRAKYGEHALNNEALPPSIQIAVYVHPLYISQSYVQSLTAPSDAVSKTPNGGSFAYERASKFIDDISLALSSSGANVGTQLTFFGLMPSDFPITSSSGQGELIAPDGVTKVTTDAEYFDLLMSDWGGDSSKYGFTEEHPLRKMRKANNADLHIYLRPFIDQVGMPSGALSKSLPEYVGNKSIVDTEVGFGFSLRTMTVYDSYWYLGAKSIAPDSNYALRVAPHQFGHVLDAGHQAELSTSPFSYGKAYQCGGFNTIMHASITPLTSYYYSTPSRSISGEACGIAVGEANEADNVSVINLQAPLLAVAAEPETTDVTVYVTAPIKNLIDGEPQNINLLRTGDLSKETVVTLISEPGTAKEGNASGDVADADYYFGVKTVVFPVDSNRVSTTVVIPERPDNFGRETFTVKAVSSANGFVSADANVIDFSIEPNVIELPEIRLEGIEDSYLEGTELEISLAPQAEISDDVELTISASSEELVAGINYELVTQNVMFKQGDSEPKVISLKLLDDATYTKEKSIQLTVSYDGELIDSAIIRVDEISEPNIGKVVAQNSALVIDNLAGELSVTLLRQGGSDAAHIVELRLPQYPDNVGPGSVTLPAPVEFLEAETEKVLDIGLSSAKPAVYTFEVYSSTTQAVMDTFTVEVKKSEALPTVTVTTNVEANENSSFAPIIINRDDATQKLSVMVEYIEDTAKIDKDFLANARVVEMQVGQESFTLQVPVMFLFDNGGDRAFKVKFSSDLANFTVDTTDVTIKDVFVEQPDDNDGKIDNYEAGSLSLWWLLVLLPLLLIRKKDGSL